MKKIFIAFVLTSLSVLAQAAPIIGEQIYNEFRCTGALEGSSCSQLIENEPISWRVHFEKALAQGSPITGGVYANSVPIKLTNEELARGYYDLDADEVENLIALATTGGVDLKVEMVEPWSSIDCPNIAKAIAGKRKDLTTVRCDGDASLKRLGQKIYVQSPDYLYDLTRTESYSVFSCEGVLQGLFDCSSLGVKEYKYDQRILEEWNVAYTSSGGITGGGDWKKQWSDFEIVPGYIPINISNITTFIVGDVKESSPWSSVEQIRINADAGTSFDSDVEIQQTGRKVSLLCAGQELLGNRGYLLDYDMETSVPSGLVDDLRSKCANGARLILSNFKATEDNNGIAATITLDLDPEGNEAYVSVNSYANDLEEHIIRKKSQFEHYLDLLDDYLSADVDGFGYKVVDYSNALKGSMEAFLGTEEGATAGVTQASIDSLFYTYPEALDLQEETGTFENLAVGFYKPATPIGNSNTSSPEWYEDFLLWVMSENVSTAYPIDLYISYIQQAASMYYGLSELPSFPYECEYKDAWLAVGDAIAVGDRFVELMTYYDPDGDNPSPAYNDYLDPSNDDVDPSNGDVDSSSYDSAFKAVNGVMFKTVDGEISPYSQFLNNSINPFGYLGMCPSGSIS